MDREGRARMDELEAAVVEIRPIVGARSQVREDRGMKPILHAE
jgi:hypothetical protein